MNQPNQVGLDLLGKMHWFTIKLKIIVLTSLMVEVFILFYLFFYEKKTVRFSCLAKIEIFFIVLFKFILE